MNSKIKNFKFVYALLGHLRPMFWVSILLFLFQGVWEVIVLSSLATFFDGMFLPANQTTAVQANPILSLVSKYLLEIPKEMYALATFLLASASFLLRDIIDTLVVVYRTKLSRDYIYKIRNDVFNLLLKCSLGYFDNIQKGSLLHMAVHETRSCYTILKTSLDLSHNVVMAVAYFIMMCLVSWEFSIIVIALCIFFFIENRLLGKFIKKYSHIYTYEFRQLTAVTDEAMGGVKQVKLLGAFDYVSRLFSRSSWNADAASRNSLLLVELQSTISSIFGIIAFFGMLYLNYKQNILSISALLAFFYLVRGLLTNLTGINQKHGTLLISMPAVNNISDFFADSEKHGEKSGKVKRDTLLQDKICFKNVSMDYGKGEVLKSINLEIPKGMTVALVGESGSGKTTIANLIPKLYEVTAGEITIDGINVNDYDLGFLRQKMALVNQDSFLFNTSIRQNILMAKQDATEEELLQATENAYAHNFINSLSEQYETRVGDRGVKLSGGQRQRINIAQAFIKGAEIVIFDEATSALDTQSELYVQKAIENLEEQKTCIIIAHRLSTIKKADKIIVMGAGRILEEGSWNELITKKGKFSDMLESQKFAEIIT